MISSVLKVYLTPARLDINTVTPFLTSKYIDAKLDIDKTKGTYILGKKSLTCEIDSTQCRAEEGHKTIRQLTYEYAQNGIENAKEAAHEAASEGQELLEAGPGENVLQEINRAKAMGSEYECGLKFIPSQPPEITWTKDDSQTDIEPSKYIYNWDVASRADIQLERAGSIDVTVAQYPDFSFEFVGDFNTLKSFECYA